MNKKKKEQIILLVLIPLFIISLIYMRLSTNRPGEAVESLYEGPMLEEKVTVELVEPITPEESGYKAGKRDPLRDLFEIFMYELKRKQPKTEPEKTEIPPLPTLLIEGLVWNSNTPQAIVNSKVVRTGDIIEGVEVTSIDKNGITVDHYGESVFVPKQ
jgi:hypothetical protein